MEEWQPIETAPKDGRPIQVWGRGRRENVQFLRESWFNNYDVIVLHEYWTHWTSQLNPPGWHICKGPDYVCESSCTSGLIIYKKGESPLDGDFVKYCPYCGKKA